MKFFAQEYLWILHLHLKTKTNHSHISSISIPKVLNVFWPFVIFLFNSSESGASSRLTYSSTRPHPASKDSAMLISLFLYVISLKARLIPLDNEPLSPKDRESGDLFVKKMSMTCLLTRERVAVSETHKWDNDTHRVSSIWDRIRRSYQTIITNNFIFVYEFSFATYSWWSIRLLRFNQLLIITVFEFDNFILCKQFSDVR